jgi:hypothetical protein
MFKRRPDPQPVYTSVPFCEFEGCINFRLHTCERCTKGFCKEHLIEDIDAKEWYCWSCWIEVMAGRGFEARVEAGGEITITSLNPTPQEARKTRKESPASPTYNIDVRPRGDSSR